jgi:uncharacterized protein YjbJ (UPF0337 family)
MTDTGMKDKAKGEFNKGVGTAKEDVGEATGNREMQAKGSIQRTEGNVQQGVGNIKKDLNKEE